MSASSILDLSMVPAARIKTAPKITGVHPFGSTILIELLNSQELTSNQIIVGDNSTDGPPQAYVLEVGPAVTCPMTKALVGKRVVVTGRGDHVPDYDDHNRTRLLVDYSAIKAVLDEDCPKINSCCCI